MNMPTLPHTKTLYEAAFYLLDLHEAGYSMTPDILNQIFPFFHPDNTLVQKQMCLQAHNAAITVRAVPSSRSNGRTLGIVSIVADDGDGGKYQAAIAIENPSHSDFRAHWPTTSEEGDE